MLNLIAILCLFFGSGTDVHQQINNFFKENLKDFTGFIAEPLNLPEDTEEIKFLSMQFPLNKSIISLPVDLKLNNGSRYKMHLSVRLSLYKDAPVALSTLDKGTELNANLFVLKKIEVNSTKGNPVFDLKEIENSICSRRISEGEILIKELIEEKPLIKTGDLVVASFISGSAVVSFNAVSRQDGKRGGIIRILSHDKKQYKAKVIAPNNVTVIE